MLREGEKTPRAVSYTIDTGLDSPSVQKPRRSLRYARQERRYTLEFPPRKVIPRRPPVNPGRNCNGGLPAASVLEIPEGSSTFLNSALRCEIWRFDFNPLTRVSSRAERTLHDFYSVYSLLTDLYRVKWWRGNFILHYFINIDIYFCPGKTTNRISDCSCDTLPVYKFNTLEK